MLVHSLKERMNNFYRVLKYFTSLECNVSPFFAIASTPRVCKQKLEEYQIQMKKFQKIVSVVFESRVVDANPNSSTIEKLVTGS